MISSGKEFATEIKNSIRNKNWDEIRKVLNGYKKRVDDEIKNLNKIKSLEEANSSRHNILLLHYGVCLAHLDLFYKYASELRQRSDYIAFIRLLGIFYEGFIKILMRGSNHNFCEIKPIKPPTSGNALEVASEEIDKEMTSIKQKIKDKEILFRLKNVEEVIKWLVDLIPPEMRMGDLAVEKKDKQKITIEVKLNMRTKEKGYYRAYIQKGKLLQKLGFEPIMLIKVSKKETHPLSKSMNESWKLKFKEDTYKFIYQLTGFKLDEWFEKNIDWKGDLDEDTIKFLKEQKWDSDLIWP